MSVSDTEETMRRYLGALLDGGDFAALFSDDVVWTTMETGEEIHGRSNVRDFIVALHTELFEASPEVRALVAGDGVAALEADFVATHIAEFAGVPATGAHVRVPYCVCYDVANGRITALRGYLPLAVLVRQLQEAAAASG